MILYPNMLLDSVTEITPEILYKNQINGLILDVDNTLINKKQEISENVKNWVKQMKSNNIKLYILSNTNDKKKVKKVSETLSIPYINLAKKPFKTGFLKVQKIFQEESGNIAVVGDQIFTDVIGGNRCNMFTILVEPIEKKEYWYTRWKRPIEDKYKKSEITKESN